MAIRPLGGCRSRAEGSFAAISSLSPLTGRGAECSVREACGTRGPILTFAVNSQHDSRPIYHLSWSPWASHPGSLALLEHAIKIYDATRAWPFRALFTAHRGAACLRAGRRDDARALGQEALRLAREHHERGHEAWALRLLGEIAAQIGSGHMSEAEGHYRDALALATELGMRPLAAHCHLGLGKLSRRTGQREQAQQHLTTATTMYREMGMTHSLEKAEAESQGLS